SIQVAVYCGLGQLEARRRPYVGFREHCGGTETASSGAGRSPGATVCDTKETGASEASEASEAPSLPPSGSGRVCVKYILPQKNGSMYLAHKISLCTRRAGLTLAPSNWRVGICLAKSPSSAPSSPSALPCFPYCFQGHSTRTY